MQQTYVSLPGQVSDRLESFRPHKLPIGPILDRPQVSFCRPSPPPQERDVADVVLPAPRHATRLAAALGEKQRNPLAPGRSPAGRPVRR